MLGFITAFPFERQRTAIPERFQIGDHPPEINAALAERIIFLTGDSLSSSARAFLDWTGNRWFSKPFQIGDLEKVVQNFLREQAELLSTVIR